MNAKNNDECLDYKEPKKYTESTIKEIIEKEIDLNSLKQLKIDERNTIIRRLYQDLDISIRQLSEAIGLGKNVIERAVRGDK